ncbi:MAG: phage baseplate assembly protein V [Anaerolineae bacterium]|jgi:uncharacterized protein involved in type VI secretion and phage assembly|nr:phage baseplate assembly protein V [Anaerolineae bacterium]
MSLTDTFRAAAVNRQQERTYGVVTGIVRDVKDPDGLGRVKVDFPWLAGTSDAVGGEGNEASSHSYWARIATLLAGAKRGSFFVPEVNDEVLVAFEHGDLSRPFVLGMLWNSQDKPPETMDGDGKNNIRSITTRSGHRIVFDDSDDTPSILIQDQTKKNRILIDSKNNALTIEVEKDMTIKVGGTLTISAGKDIAISADGGISLRATKALEMKTDQDGTLSASMGLTLKAGTSLAAEGGAQASLKAPSASVSGDAMTEIKGGLVKIN